MLIIWMLRWVFLSFSLHISVHNLTVSYHFLLGGGETCPNRLSPELPSPLSVQPAWGLIPLQLMRAERVRPGPWLPHKLPFAFSNSSYSLTVMKYNGIKSPQNVLGLRTVGNKWNWEWHQPQRSFLWREEFAIKSGRDVPTKFTH